MSRSSPLFEQFGKSVDQARCGDAAFHAEAQALAGELVDNREDLDATGILGAIHEEVVAPNVIRMLCAQPRTTVLGLAEPASFPALLRHSQTFFAPEPLHLTQADIPARANQQRANTAIAVARVLTR